MRSVQNFFKAFTFFCLLHCASSLMSQTGESYQFVNYGFVRASVTQAGRVSMDWMVMAESNVSYYEIEKFHGDTAFQKIGILTATGNNQMDLQYHFIDKPQDTGDAFYRIRAIMFSGEINYSEVMHVVVEEAKEGEVLIIPRRHYAML